jgi:hypothetical protein
MCNIWSVRLVVCVSKSVARRRLVERENPSACATVNCRSVCKSGRALYCLCVNVIKSECVTQLLINPMIITRSCLISGVYHHTRHNIYYISANTTLLPADGVAKTTTMCLLLSVGYRSSFFVEVADKTFKIYKKTTTTAIQFYIYT